MRIFRNFKIVAIAAGFFLLNPGYAQNALDFDGSDDRVDCGNDTSVQIGGKAITLEAWIYPRSWTTNAYEGNVICKEYNTSNYGYMLRVGAGGKLNFALGDGSWHEITTGTLLSLNTWQHIAGTYDGSKMRVYLNGNAVDSLVYSSDIVKNTMTNLFIGAHLTYNRFYQGAIDEVRIWSICRSAAELSAGMGSELCAYQKGLRAYYKFNQGKAGSANGTIKTLKDLSIYGNNGLLGSWFALSGSTSNWIKGKSLYREKYHAYDTVVRCDAYNSPSGRYRWTNSGNYTDTIPTYYDCDSVIHFALTIKKSTTSNLSVKACWAYKSPSGNYTWTKTGTYKDYLKNAAGCDSTITIKLVIGGKRDTITAQACNSYTSPDGSATWTQSGFYSDTLTDYLGCDSIVCVRLTIDTTVYHHIYPTACRFYISPKGRVYKSAGIYHDTFAGYKGCDSVLVIHLSMRHTYGTVNMMACNQMKSPGKKQLWTSSGIYQDTLVNKAGCDSFLTVNLTINLPATGTESVQACRYYISPGRGRKWSQTGVYTDTLVAANGCDSVVTVQLTVINIEKTLTLSGNTLTSDQIAATYQWLDCGQAYAPVNGTTARQFTPAVNGTYACEIRFSGCVDTSVCKQVTGLNAMGIGTDNVVRVYPNPTKGNFTLWIHQPEDWTSVEIADLSGRTVAMLRPGNQREWNVSVHEAPGIYMIRFSGEKQRITVPLLVE